MGSDAEILFLPQGASSGKIDWSDTLDGGCRRCGMTNDTKQPSHDNCCENTTTTTTCGSRCRLGGRRWRGACSPQLHAHNSTISMVDEMSGENAIRTAASGVREPKPTPLPSGGSPPLGTLLKSPRVLPGIRRPIAEATNSLDGGPRTGPP